MWLSEKTVLANDNRKAIADRVRTQPGIAIRQLATEMRLHYKTALYHARVLERSGALSLGRNAEGRFVCYHRAVPRPPPAPPEVPPRSRPAPRVVGRLPSVRDGRSAAAVGRMLGLHRSTAYAWLRRLEARGIVRLGIHGWVPSSNEAFSLEPRLAQVWSSCDSAP